MNSEFNNTNNQNNNQSNNNKNNQNLIIGLCIAGVVIVMLVIGGVFAWNKYVDYKYQKADDEIKDNIDNIGDLDDIKDNNKQDNDSNSDNPNDNYDMLGEIPNSKITYRDYKSTNNYTECSGKYNFNINNGILTLSDLGNNKKYSLKKVTNLKSMIAVSSSFSCELELYYFLTTDGKIYRTNNTLNNLSDVSAIENFVDLMKSNYNFTYTDLGVVGYTIDENGMPNIGLIAKTTTDDEIIFTDHTLGTYGFYRVIE